MYIVVVGRGFGGLAAAVRLQARGHDVTLLDKRDKPGGLAHAGRCIMYSKVKIFGHPIHPMLIAYPIALYTATLVAFIIAAARSGDLFWFRVAVVANIAGVIMAAVAALPGFIDWAMGIPAESPAKGHGLRHMLLNVTALVLFLINAIIHAGQWSSSQRDTGWGIVLALVGVLCTVGAGFFGWTMIQDDHVGVALSPEQERLEPTVAGVQDGPLRRPRAGAP